MKRDSIQYSQLIDKDNLYLLDQYFVAEGGRPPSDTNLDKLVGEPDLSSTRTTWVAFASPHPSLVDRLMKEITTCSCLILIAAQESDVYTATEEERETLKNHLLSGQFKLIIGGELEERINVLTKTLDIDTYDCWKPVIDSDFMKEHVPDVKKLIQQITTSVSNKALEKSTRLNIAVLFLRNALINAPLMSQPDPLSGIPDSRSNQPVLIVSAGPSLNKQLALLEQQQDLFTIVAVDTVWPILTRSGITPDVVIALDPTNPPLWPTNGISEKTTLVLDIGCHPKLALSHDRGVLFTSSMPQLQKCIETLGGHSGHLRTGGSVATTAFNFARLIGGNPIIFIGQDLALTDGKDHADGYPDAYQPDRLKSVHAQGFDVEGYYGGLVRAERQLVFYREWFEKEISEIKDVLVINSTEGGARIRGTLQIPFATVCSEIRSTSLRKPPQLINDKRSLNIGHLEKIIKNLDELIQKIESFKQITENGKKATGRTEQAKRKSLFRTIDRINKKITEFDTDAKYVISLFGARTIDHVWKQAIRRTNMTEMDHAIEKYNEIYEASILSSEAALKFLHRIQSLYKKLKEAGDFNSDFIDEVLR